MSQQTYLTFTKHSPDPTKKTSIWDVLRASVDAGVKLAAMFSISAGQISSIRKGVSWKHVQ